MSKPFQFGLRTLLLAVFLVGVALALMPVILFAADYVLFEHFYITSALITCCCIRFGERSRLLAVRPRVLGSVVLIGLMLVTAYVFWTRHRWITPPVWQATPPLPWFYPDPLLSAYHDWLDRLYVVDGPYIKIHAEVYRVWGHLNYLAAGLVGAAGFAFGATFSDFVGRVRKGTWALTIHLVHWLRNRIWRETRSE